MASIRQDLALKINNILLSYDEMIQARKDPNNLTKFNTLADALRKEIYNVRNFDIVSKKQELDKICDECLKYGNEDSEANLKCRICRMPSNDRANFQKTIQIRKDFRNKVSRLKIRTVGYAELKTKNGAIKVIKAHSGEDQALLKDILDIAQVPTSTIFSTQKGNFNDSEIKILDYIQKNYPDSEVYLLYTDRYTCPYCQEVIAKIKSKEIKPKFYLGVVGSGPIYHKEDIDDNKITIIENILKNGCK